MLRHGVHPGRMMARSRLRGDAGAAPLRRRQRAIPRRPEEPGDEEHPMPDVELERKQELSREEAGRRLIAIGNALVEGAESKLEMDGDSLSFTVADQVRWEFELEVDGNETELEIELKWSDAPAARASS
jgi:amphi-Trp domain-containing protein